MKAPNNSLLASLSDLTPRVIKVAVEKYLQGLVFLIHYFRYFKLKLIRIFVFINLAVMYFSLIQWIALVSLGGNYEYFSTLSSTV